MQKPFQMILYALLALMAVNLILNISGRSHIGEVIKKLEASQHNIDIAIKEINVSRSRLDSIQVDLTKFKYYIQDIQQNVASMDLEKKIKQSKDWNTFDSLRQRQILLNTRLKITDSLPPLNVKPL